MVPTCKNVAPYSPTPLNVGTMVNAPLCNSLYLFLYFLCHPYILAIFVENCYYILVSVLFMVCKLRMLSATRGHPCRLQYRTLFL